MKLHEAPFALACDGTVLLNLAEFDGTSDLETAVAVARQQGGVVFIGVVMDRREAKEALGRLKAGFSEAGAYAIGARQRRARERAR